jgi:hypothetical protein
VGAWWQTNSLPFLIAGLAMFCNLPWTFFEIYPTTTRLEATPEDAADETTRALILRWGRLHAGRTVFGFAAVAAFWVAFAQN